jgi:hypothetical protein
MLGMWLFSTLQQLGVVMRMSMSMAVSAMRVRVALHGNERTIQSPHVPYLHDDARP